MGYKILVVDDDEMILEALSRSLTGAGYEVVVGRDGEEALLQVETQKPDVILLDLTMPKKNGFEVLEEVRRRYRKWIPVIIHSAQNDLESIRKSYAFEADHYLTKPSTLQRVLDSVKTMVSLIPSRQE